MKSLDHNYATVLAFRRVPPLDPGAAPLPTIAIVGTDGESGTRLSILGFYTLSGPPLLDKHRWAAFHLLGSSDSSIALKGKPLPSKMFHRMR